MATQILHRTTRAVLFASETAADLRAAVIEAVGARADLTGADLTGAYLAGADLTDAYLAGADLTDANLEDANLKDANLKDANLKDANLIGAYLAGSNLEGANLARACIAGAYLAREDAFEHALHYRKRHPKVPAIEALDAKILAVLDAGAGVLAMDAWHACETTHCRAGWAVHLAGKAGYALEERLGSAELAGAAIYRASTGRVPDFFCDDETALADIRKCAAEQAASEAP